MLCYIRNLSKYLHCLDVKETTVSNVVVSTSTVSSIGSLFNLEFLIGWEGKAAALSGKGKEVFPLSKQLKPRLGNKPNENPNEKVAVGCFPSFLIMRI